MKFRKLFVAPIGKAFWMETLHVSDSEALKYHFINYYILMGNIFVQKR